MIVTPLVRKTYCASVLAHVLVSREILILDAALAFRDKIQMPGQHDAHSKAKGEAQYVHEDKPYPG